MPQLSQIGEIYASQLFWLAIVFALIYFGIGRAMVPKIEATVDDRNARISGDLAAAAAARATTEASEAAYQADVDAARAKAQAAVNEAKSSATANAEAQVKKGDKKQADQVAKAAAGIETARLKALAEIQATTVDAAEAIVAKLSGTAVDHAAVADLVKAKLAHV